MNVVFRVDSSFQLGIGHVMRCLTLAKQLLTIGANIYFICRDLQGNVIPLIRNNHFPVSVLSGKDTEKDTILNWYGSNWDHDAYETETIIQDLKADLVIVDHYGLDWKWEEIIKKSVNKLMVIDDLANRKHVCDILLDQNYYRNYPERYNFLVPTSSIKLLGPNYVLLRDEFLHENFIRIRGEVRNILVFFGGTDPTNETLKTLNALEHLISQNIIVNVIAGQTNRKKRQIEDVCRSNNFNFYCQVSNMADFINEADIAIGAGGTAIWERSILGLPSLIIMVAENQVEVTKAVNEYGAAINLGFHFEVSSQDISNNIDELIGNPEKVKELSRYSLELVSSEIVRSFPVLNTIRGVL